MYALFLFFEALVIVFLLAMWLLNIYRVVLFKYKGKDWAWGLIGIPIFPIGVLISIFSMS